MTDDTRSKIVLMRDQAMLHPDVVENLAANTDEPDLKAELLDAVKTSSDHIAALNHVLRVL